MHAFGISMTRKSAVGFVYALLASILTITAMFGASPAFAAVEPFPPDFKIQSITVNGATLHVRVGGKGPAVVLLHGFADTGDMWAPLAKALYKDHTVIVPHLRGMGIPHRSLAAQCPVGPRYALGQTARMANSE